VAQQKSYTATQILRKSLMEATFHQMTARRVKMMNWNAVAKFLMIKHVHISPWENKVD
jgi:hypothetical protein